MIVGPAMRTMVPNILHCHELDAVAFQGIDSLEGDSACDDWAQPLPGIVRPLLKWRTQFCPNGHSTAVVVTEGASVNKGELV